VVFLRDSPLSEIAAGRKRHEVRLSFGRLACESVREGDVLLLKRVGGEVEAACDVGEVRIYRGLSPERIAEVVQEYPIGSPGPYFRRYLPAVNRDRLVNLAVIELMNVREASLPVETTPRGVRSGWVADFDPGDEGRE
jgi:hypothetical protein